MKSMGNGHQVFRKLLSAKDLERFKLNFVVSLPLLGSEYEDEDYQEDTDDTGSEEAEVVVASDFLESAFGLYNIAQKKLISDQTCLEAIRLAIRLAQAGEVEESFAEDDEEYDDEYTHFFPQESVQVEVPGNPDDERAYMEASKEAVISVLEKAPKNEYPTVYFYLEKDDDQTETPHRGAFLETFLNWLSDFGTVWDRELMHFDHESAYVSGKVKVLSFDWERKSLVLNYAIEVSVKRKHEISMQQAMAIARSAGLLESEEEESEEERYVPRVVQVSRHGEVDTILEVKLGDEWDYRVEDDEDAERRYVRLSLPCTPLSASIITSSWGKLEITLVPANQGHKGERVLRVEVEGGEWIQAGNPKTEVHKLVKENVEEAKPPTLRGLVSALNQLRKGVLGKTFRGLFGDGIEDFPLLSGRALLREILHMIPLCLEGREVWAIAEAEGLAGRNEGEKVPSLLETFKKAFPVKMSSLYHWEEKSILNAISQFLWLYVDETLSAAETELGPKEYIVRPKESEIRGIGKFFERYHRKLYGVELVLGVDRDEGSVEKVVVSDQQSGNKREVQLVKRVIFEAGRK